MKEIIDFIMSEGIVVALIAGGSGIICSLITGIITNRVNAAKMEETVKRLPELMKEKHDSLSGDHDQLSSEHKDLSKEHREIYQKQNDLLLRAETIIGNQSVMQEHFRVKDQMPLEAELLKQINEVYLHNKELLLENRSLQQKIEDLSRQVKELPVQQRYHGRDQGDYERER